MIRSLTFKLLLIVLLTNIGAILLAAVMIRQFLTREFDDYVLAERRTAFVSDVSAYYRAHGSLAGLAQGLRPGRFVLLDPAGVVLIASDRYQVGEYVAPSEELRRDPVTIDGRLVGTVLTLNRSIFRDLAQRRYLERSDMALGVTATVVGSIALLVGVLLARLVTRPVRELTIAAQAIADGDLAQQVPVRSRDELGLLAAQFNRMSADLAQAHSLRRQMTADVAHDLRTPLTVIAGYLEALRDGGLAPTSARFGAMHDETQVLLRLVDELHTLSLADAGELLLERRPLEARRLLERVAESYRLLAERCGVAVTVSAAGDLPPLLGDEEQLARVVGNLVSNALRYSAAGGRIALAARATASELELTVTDSGAGIAPEHLPHIFERFYRADPARQRATGGSGLGLAIVKSITQAHGGTVSVSSEPGCETCFTLVFPLSPHSTS